MVWIPICAAAVSAMVSLLGVRNHMHHMHHKHLSMHLDQLESRVKIFGELYLSLLLSRQIYMDFTSIEGYEYPKDFDEMVRDIEDEPLSQTAIRYRALMGAVLGPIQMQIIDLISSNLIIFECNQQLKKAVLSYVYMASSYKMIFSRWEQRNFNIHFSSRRFPEDLIETLENEYNNAKEEIEYILNTRMKVSRRSKRIAAKLIKNSAGKGGDGGAAGNGDSKRRKEKAGSDSGAGASESAKRKS